MTDTNTNTETAILAGGCFWCLEAVYDGLEGVSEVQSGYIGGDVDNPSYEAVCSGRTGHAEAVRIIFDPSVLTFDDLLDVFFVIHDPTTLNRQGADVGTQYRSEIFATSPDSAAPPKKRSPPSRRITPSTTRSSPLSPTPAPSTSPSPTTTTTSPGTPTSPTARPSSAPRSPSSARSSPTASSNPSPTSRPNPGDTSASAAPGFGEADSPRLSI